MTPLDYYFSPEQLETQQERWDEVEHTVDEAHGIAWDGCHKIYVLLDAGQVEVTRGYGYGQDDDGSELITSKDTSSAELCTRVRSWFEDSCGLRFINAVVTGPADPASADPVCEYEPLIPQGDPAFDPDPADSAGEDEDDEG